MDNWEKSLLFQLSYPNTIIEGRVLSHICCDLMVILVNLHYIIYNP